MPPTPEEKAYNGNSLEQGKSMPLGFSFRRSLGSVALFFWFPFIAFFIFGMALIGAGAGGAADFYNSFGEILLSVFIFLFVLSIYFRIRVSMYVRQNRFDEANKIASFPAILLGVSVVIWIIFDLLA
jgi:hypothetical protein